MEGLVNGNRTWTICTSVLPNTLWPLILAKQDMTPLYWKSMNSKTSHHLTSFPFPLQPNSSKQGRSPNISGGLRFGMFHRIWTHFYALVAFYNRNNVPSNFLKSVCT